MYSNRRYPLREKIAFLRHYLVSRLSLFYFKFISRKRITFVRDGGIGDAIMSTAIISQFKRENPNTQINLSVSFPTIYKTGSNVRFGPKAFPIIRLSYGHHDLSWFKTSDTHFRKVMAEMAGVGSKQDLINEINEEPIPNGGILPDLIKNKNFAVIQPEAGAWFPEKNWTNDKWKGLVSRVSIDFDDIYQIGIESEAKVEGTIDLRGQLSISESISLIKHSNFFFGVSSFGEQVAGTYNVPSVIIYGPTHPIYALNKGQIAVYGIGGNLHEFGKDLHNYGFPKVNDVEVEDAHLAYRKMQNSLT